MTKVYPPFYYSISPFKILIIGVPLQSEPIDPALVDSRFKTFMEPNTFRETLRAIEENHSPQSNATQTGLLNEKLEPHQAKKSRLYELKKSSSQDYQRTEQGERKEPEKDKTKEREKEQQERERDKEKEKDREKEKKRFTLPFKNFFNMEEKEGERREKKLKKTKSSDRDKSRKSNSITLESMENWRNRPYSEEETRDESSGASDFRAVTLLDAPEIPLSPVPHRLGMEGNQSISPMYAFQRYFLSFLTQYRDSPQTLSPLRNGSSMYEELFIAFVLTLISSSPRELPVNYPSSSPSR